MSVAILLLIVVALVVIVACFMAKKIVGAVISIVLFALVFWTFFTVAYGDGHDIVHAFTHFLSPNVAESIEDAYDSYYNAMQDVQIFDSEKIADFSEAIKDKVISESTQKFNSKDNDQLFFTKDGAG